MSILVSRNTERDLAQVAAMYTERRGSDLASAEVIGAVVAALREVLRAEQPVTRERPLTEEERAILRAGGFDLEPRAGAGARLRTASTMATIIADAFTTPEAAHVLGVTPGRIRQRLEKREIYGIPWKRGWRIPRFQFDGGALVPQVERVLPRLDPALAPIAVFNWFTLPNDDLRDGAGAEMSPRAWLVAGQRWEPLAEQAARL